MIYHKWRHFTSSHNVIIHKIRNWLQNIDLKTSKSFHRQNLRKYDSRKLLVEWRNLLVLDHIRRIFDQHQRRPLLEWLRQRNHVISLYTPGIKNVFDHKLWCLNVKIYLWFSVIIVQITILRNKWGTVLRASWPIWPCSPTRALLIGYQIFSRYLQSI